MLHQARSNKELGMSVGEEVWGREHKGDEDK